MDGSYDVGKYWYVVYVWFVIASKRIEIDDWEEFMTFGKQVRLAGAVTCIIAAVTNTIVLNLIGLLAMFIGVVIQVDNLEQRLIALEPKGDNDDETEA